MLRQVFQSIVLSLGIIAVNAAQAAAFISPADTPAMPSKFAATSPLQAVAAAGKRIVGVGLRGHIVYSDDDGKTWAQANVPVSTDLLAVSFPTPQHGWAAGHGGILLHSEDGGINWSKQLAGKQAALQAVKYYETHGAESGAERALAQAKNLLADAEAGSAQPFLDVLFENEKSGFVVGTFNQIFHTDDGGLTWTPWMARVDNPSELHFYAIRSTGRRFYLVGEQGKVWYLDPKEQKYVMVATPYAGTLFGSVVDASNVLVFGMRGSVFRSTDDGKNWERIAVGSRAGISGGTVLADGRILLVSLAGEVFQSKDQGKTFVLVKMASPMSSYFGVSRIDNSSIGLVGMDGIRVGSVQ